MTHEEWVAAWQELEDILLSENGEESMPLVHAMAKQLVQSGAKPIGSPFFPTLYSTLRIYLGQTGVTKAFREKRRLAEIDYRT